MPGISFPHLSVRLPAALLACFLLPAARAEIVFSAKVLGPVANIYAVDGGSGELRKVTDNIRWRDLDADVNTAGTIVFSSNREPDPRMDLRRSAENFNLYITEPGKSPRLLVSGPRQELMPRLAPTGERIAYLERGGARQRLMLTEDGGKSQALLEADEIFDFSWSPDGKNLAVALRRDGSSGLWRVSIRGGGREWYAEKGAAHIVSARWSPVGEKIAFIRHPLDGPGRSLWVFEPASGERKKISAKGREVQQSPEWSADGARLLYAALVGYKFFYDESAQKKVYRGAMHIFESALDGKTRQLTEGGGLHRAPVYSPEEDRVAYLYADRLDSRSLALRVTDRSGGEARELYGAVAQRSGLRWN